MNSELRSGLRSVRLWAWLTFTLFVVYFTCGLLRVDQSIRTFTARGYIAEDHARLTVFDWTILVSFNLLFIGVPAVFTVLAASAAGNALAGDDLRPLVRIVIWSRRFLVISTLWLVGCVVVGVLLVLSLAS